MDIIFQTLLSWQFLFFSIAIAAVMFVLKNIVEYLMSTWSPAAKEKKLWNRLLLPILPIIIGALGGLIDKGFPYPDGLSIRGGRVVFGLVAGLLSTFVYRLIKGFISQKTTSFTTSNTPTTSDASTTPVVTQPPVPVKVNDVTNQDQNVSNGQ